MIDLKKLSKDLAEAVEYAQTESKDIDDSKGSCNHDHLFFCTQGARASKALKTALSAGGCDSTYYRSRWWRGYHVDFATGGQRAKNERAVHFAHQFLQGRGWTQFAIYYMMN